MTLIVYSKSRSFERHIDSVIDGDVTFRSKLAPPGAVAGNVYLLHAQSFTKELPDWLASACAKGAVIGIAVESPQIEDLLAYTQIGVLGYFNAYMSAPNYEQVMRLLNNGQSWYPAPLITQVFDLARTAMPQASGLDPLEMLTKREREIALAVAEGKSNKLIASDCDISERTVKTHLTNLFKKLEVKDRVALVIYLNQFDTLKANRSSAG